MKKHFNHVDQLKYNIPKLEVKTDKESGTRFYYNGNKKYPSVTTVLSHSIFDSLEAWRKNIGYEEAKKITTKAARRGTFVHELCEDYLNNKENYLSGYLPNIVESFLDIKETLDDNIDNIRGQEIALSSDTLMVAGRCDCICEWNNVPSILDFKTSKKQKPRKYLTNYFIQTTAYSLMWEELTGESIEQIVICIAIDNKEPMVCIDNREHWLAPLKDVIIKFYKERM